MQLEEQIAERVSGFAYDRIDADLLHLLKRNVVDSYAGICGSLKDKTMLANFDRLAAGPASARTSTSGVSAGRPPTWTHSS